MGWWSESISLSLSGRCSRGEPAAKTACFSKNSSQAEDPLSMDPSICIRLGRLLDYNILLSGSRYSAALGDIVIGRVAEVREGGGPTIGTEYVLYNFLGLWLCC